MAALSRDAPLDIKRPQRDLRGRVDTGLTRQNRNVNAGKRRAFRVKKPHMPRIYKPHRPGIYG
jgi:hypothetical protein